jgi:hypothetical protein
MEKIVAYRLLGVTSVPIIIPRAQPGAAGIPTAFIENYGAISMMECHAHGTTIMGAQDRHNQNSGILAGLLNGTPLALIITLRRKMSNGEMSLTLTLLLMKWVITNIEFLFNICLISKDMMMIALKTSLTSVSLTP